LTSNTTSLGEIAGDAALLVNPESINEIEMGIVALSREDGLRNDLISKGIARSQQFSWQATAQKTFAVYEELL
jgi:glycosyltransferase involved in cell wall biosynthesis